jgi:N-methylhydantoinase B
MSADPITLEIVAGTLASIEAEVEEAIGRTSRSPMIRDQHDFRAGIHDRRLRKLTGRSYSALVHPVVRDFPIDTMSEGDIYFHNDVYLSEGGIGHLPDLCVTVPVFCMGKVVAFVQAFGHHDDIGGMVPGSMPSNATSAFQEGLMVPPIKLYDRGELNGAVMRIIARNSRLPDSIAGDLDAECAAVSMGARRMTEMFERYGPATVEECFDALISKTAETFRREVLSKIPDGTYVWEDYAEHDGVDPPRLHAQRITLTKRGDRLLVDFNGTSPQARGPINHAGDYADGNFLKKWIAPLLRNLADTPERMAELDVNEGVAELIDMRFPPPGTLLTPVYPAPTNARTFVILRLLGVFAGALAKAVDGNMPADQETIRYTGITGYDRNGDWYLYREILGGGSGGRSYADGSDTIHVVPDSKNMPAEFIETTFPARVERLELATDSGGPGLMRGGLGYLKEIRVLEDATFLSVADRSILSCWGLKGGRAGTPFRVTIDPDGPDERVLPGLADGEPVRAGQLVRIETTGGGGWGDPLARDPEAVARDVLQRKVSRDSARSDYGVVLAGEGDEPEVDGDATHALRERMRAQRPPLELFDRGPGYRSMAGRERAEVDRMGDGDVETGAPQALGQEPVGERGA